MVATSSSTPGPAASDVRSLDELRDFIHVSLCRRENLLEYHFPMTEMELKKGDRRCGLQFVLHGPRQVKLAAVWAEDRNEVLLYAASGQRFSRIRLPNRVR